MIDNQQMSYTEWAAWLDSSSLKASEGDDLQVIKWAEESQALRPQVCILPESQNLIYQYEYRNLGLVKERLLRAGLRLAGVLNQIYG